MAINSNNKETLLPNNVMHCSRKYIDHSLNPDDRD